MIKIEYIIFTISEITVSQNKSNKTPFKILNQFEKIGFIERKRQELGKPNVTYEKDFMRGTDKKCNNLHFRS